jgi:hypothetical protein
MSGTERIASLAFLRNAAWPMVETSRKNRCFRRRGEEMRCFEEKKPFSAGEATSHTC